MSSFYTNSVFYFLSFFFFLFFWNFKRISLYVDDEECGTLRFSRRVLNVRAPTLGGLFIGGIPNSFQPTEELEIKNAFNGTIKDLVFNGRMMDLNRKIFLNSTFIF